MGAVIGAGTGAMMALTSFYSKTAPFLATIVVDRLLVGLAGGVLAGLLLGVMLDHGRRPLARS
jgi:hypothetical protein